MQNAHFILHCACFLRIRMSRRVQRTCRNWADVGERLMSFVFVLFVESIGIVDGYRRFALVVPYLCDCQLVSALDAGQADVYALVSSTCVRLLLYRWRWWIPRTRISSSIYWSKRSSLSPWYMPACGHLFSKMASHQSCNRG